MDDKLARLREIGFTIIGQWKMAEGGIDYELKNFADASKVLYAFVVDNELMYVGKTIQPLRARMAGYRAPGVSQSTNIKNNSKIHACLMNGKRVDIHALPDNGLLHVGSFHLNTAAGLEDSLVRDLNPPWNGGRKEAANQSLQPIKNSLSVSDEPLNKPSLKLQNVTAEHFRVSLLEIFKEAMQSTANFIDINAGQLHRRVGGYPGSNHRMPVCCDVMRKIMQSEDKIIAEPPKGKGATLTVRYIIPRLI
jgi:hypothetical protein